MIGGVQSLFENTPQVQFITALVLTLVSAVFLFFFYFNRNKYLYGFSLVNLTVSTCLFVGLLLKNIHTTTSIGISGVNLALVVGVIIIKRSSGGKK